MVRLVASNALLLLGATNDFSLDSHVPPAKQDAPAELAPTETLARYVITWIALKQIPWLHRPGCPLV
jgi:hypothetical protein